MLESLAPTLDFHSLDGLSIRGPLINTGTQERDPVTSSCLVSPFRNVHFLSAVQLGLTMPSMASGASDGVPSHEVV